MYDVHRLRLLRELARRGTLASVANALGYNPSSISHQLGLLERETGVTLLEPSGRGVRLTPAARALVTHAENILRELELAEATVAASRGEVTGTVRIATFQTAARGLVLDAIEQLANAHPRLTVAFTHVDAGAAIPALIARDFDIVLSEEYPGAPLPRDPAIVSRLSLTDPLILAIPAEWQESSLEELAARPWVMEHAGTAARNWSDATCRSAGFEPHVVFETADLFLHADVVDRGLAAAFLPGLGPSPASAKRVETGQARAVTLYVRSGGENSPAVAAVSAAIAATAGIEAPERSQSRRDARRLEA
ncbi:LysR family transcriptional regulator [uncultured Agrococcus sp.]|uniref:LysR family transcriptional regulator n=1 Tax=uncultured Agrococcus sp. TaxID=382258 RepID=UPI0025E4ED2D|nr:LysR family transcriptional regulator [uncultured Agrococcus sp.]